MASRHDFRMAEKGEVAEVSRCSLAKSVSGDQKPGGFTMFYPPKSSICS